MKKNLILFLIFPFFVFSQNTDWVRSFGGDESDKGISIGVDSLGFIYVSGYFNTSATFGTITLTNSPASGTNKEMFVIKMDSLGNVLWAIAGGDQTGSCCDDRALGMHVTPGGDVFITGTFWSTYDLGSCSVSNSQGNSHDTSVLAKIDKDGNCVWVIAFGTNNTSGGCPWPIYDADDHSYDVKVDQDGFIYVTGFFSGYNAEFDGFTIDNPDWGTTCTPLGYIGKLDQSGNWLWVDKFDGIKDARGSRDNRLAIDQYSNIYVCGGFENTANYGPLTLNSNGEWDAFIFKMDTDGNWIWARNVGSNKTDRANSIAVDVCDDIYVTGEYRNPMVFQGADASNGTDTLSHKQKRDVFVAKINSQGNWQWAKRARSSGTDKSYQMSVDNNKQVFICGTMGDTATFNNSTVINPPNPNDTTNSAFIAQLDGTTNNGSWLWAKMAGCSTDDDDRTNDICPDGFGNVYAVGFYEDLANFDGTVLDATGRKKDIFVWKVSQVERTFVSNNTYDTVYTTVMEFNPLDTGVFTVSTYSLNGCDTNFVDSIIYKRLAVEIVYTINNPGTATISINGIIQPTPYSEIYWAKDAVAIDANLAPGWLFSYWQSNNNNILPTNNSLNASFIADYSDTILLMTYPQPQLSAFISGDDTICSNNIQDARVEISFNGGSPPYNFTYAINGIQQTSITTSLNPHIIETKEEGVYTLISFSDATDLGAVSGSAIVTILEPPLAIFEPQPDTLSIVYTTTYLLNQSEGDIQSWLWDFGDNSSLDSISSSPYHTFSDIGIYQVSLVVKDIFGCLDTARNHIWITDEFWIYIPNSFTPDKDGLNDIFCINYNGIREESFYFNIYNRDSELVYSTKNIDDLRCYYFNSDGSPSQSSSIGWNGRYDNTNQKAPSGTYVYEIYYQDHEGWKHHDQGYIYLVR